MKEKKKTNGLSRHLSPVGALPESGPAAFSCPATRGGTSEETSPVPGSLFHNWALPLSWGLGGSDLVGERLLLLVESEGPGYTANPTGAACWYRMIAAGSTSLWSLSFRSPLPLLPPSFGLSPSLFRSRWPSHIPSLSRRAALLALPCPRSRSRSLAPSYRRPAALSLREGTPRQSHETRRLLLSPAAFLPFRSSLFRCPARRISSLSLPRFAFLVSSLSPLPRRWLVHWFHRCTGPGSPYSFL